MVWLIFTDFFLVLSAIGIVYFRCLIGLPDALIGSFVGALLSAAIAFAGVMVQRWVTKNAEERIRAEENKKNTNTYYC